jgi:hypothetical protein
MLSSEFTLPEGLGKEGGGGWQGLEGKGQYTGQNETAMLLLGIHPKGCKSIYKRDTCTPMFIAAPYIPAKIWI